MFCEQKCMNLKQANSSPFVYQQKGYYSLNEIWL